MRVLYRLQDGLNAACAHPMSFACAIAFLGSWFAAGFSSHGRFDPGFGVGNLIVNGVGLVVMFAAASIASRTNANLAGVHERLDEQGGHLAALRVSDE
jgi:hypothetical protein